MAMRQQLVWKHVRIRICSDLKMYSHFKFLFLLGVLFTSIVVSLKAQELRAPEEGVITVSNYCDFLNAVAGTDCFYDGKMGADLGLASILRSGESGSYRYEFAPTTKPDDRMLFLSWNNAIQYCDWKNYVSLKSAASTFNVSSYDIDAASFDPELKSNQLTFYLVGAEANAYQAVGEEIAITGGADAMVEGLEGLALVFFGWGISEGVQGSEKEQTPPRHSSNTRDPNRMAISKMASERNRKPSTEPQKEITRVIRSAQQPSQELMKGGYLFPDLGGCLYNGRRYTQHALERMAPDTPEIIELLLSRAFDKMETKGLELKKILLLENRKTTEAIEFHTEFCFESAWEFEEMEAKGLDFKKTLLADEKTTQEMGVQNWDWWRECYPEPRRILPSVVEAEIAHPGTTDVRVVTSKEGDVITVIRKQLANDELPFNYAAIEKRIKKRAKTIERKLSLFCDDEWQETKSQRVQMQEYQQERMMQRKYRFIRNITPTLDQKFEKWEQDTKASKKIKNRASVDLAALKAKKLLSKATSKANSQADSQSTAEGSSNGKPSANERVTNKAKKDVREAKAKKIPQAATVKEPEVKPKADCVEDPKEQTLAPTKEDTVVSSWEELVDD